MPRLGIGHRPGDLQGGADPPEGPGHAAPGSWPTCSTTRSARWKLPAGRAQNLRRRRDSSELDTWSLFPAHLSGRAAMISKGPAPAGTAPERAGAARTTRARAAPGTAASWAPGQQAPPLPAALPRKAGEAGTTRDRPGPGPWRAGYLVIRPGLDQQHLQGEPMRPEPPEAG
jgi:hypothetical protein